MSTSRNNPFSDIDSTKVYSRVLAALDSTERSLWLRLNSELRTSGVSGAESYLRSEFQAAFERIEERLKSFEEAANTTED
jgi:hypothetical protein